jgi:hypothetical protein
MADGAKCLSQIPLEVERFHGIIEEVLALSITHPLDFDSLSYIIKFLNKFPQKAPRLQPGILDVSPLLTSVGIDTYDDTWDALQELERLLTPPLFLGRRVKSLRWTMGAVYGDGMARYVIGLLARFRCAKGVTFGVQEWFDVEFLLEADTSVGWGSETGSSNFDTEETLFDMKKAKSPELTYKTTEEPAFIPLPKIFHWETTKLDFPLMGASTILSFGCWPHMRHLTLNLAVPSAWPGRTELEIAITLACTISRISFLFPSLQTLRLSTSMVPCDPISFTTQAPSYYQTLVPFKGGAPTTPMDNALYSAALLSLGSKALVPPLVFLTNLEVRAIPQPLLLTFASQWTCRAMGRNVQLSLRSGGWVVEGEEDEYDEWTDFSNELAKRAGIARENDTEMNWDRNCYDRRLMTGKTREELAQVPREVRIKVNVKG